MFGQKTPDACRLRREQGRRAILLVQGEGQRPRPSGEGVPFALTAVQFVAQTFDLGLRLGDGGPGGGCGLGRVALAGVHCGRLDRQCLGGQCLEVRFSRVDPTAGGIEGVLLSQHLAAHGCEATRGGLGLSGQLGEVQVVPGDQHGLLGDLFVEGVEAAARLPGCHAGGSPGGVGHSDATPQRLDLGGGIRQHGRGHAAADVGGLGLRAEQRQPLVGEGVQAAKAFLHGFEAETRAPGQIDGIADLLLLEPAQAPLPGFELLGQHQSFGVPLALSAAVRVKGGA